MSEPTSSDVIMNELAFSDDILNELTSSDDVMSEPPCDDISCDDIIFNRIKSLLISE